MLRKKELQRGTFTYCSYPHPHRLCFRICHHHTIPFSKRIVHHSPVWTVLYTRFYPLHWQNVGWLVWRKPPDVLLHVHLSQRSPPWRATTWRHFKLDLLTIASAYCRVWHHLGAWLPSIRRNEGKGRHRWKMRISSQLLTGSLAPFMVWINGSIALALRYGRKQFQGEDVFLGSSIYGPGREERPWRISLTFNKYSSVKATTATGIIQPRIYPPMIFGTCNTAILPSHRQDKSCPQSWLRYNHSPRTEDWFSAIPEFYGRVTPTAQQ